MTPSLRFNPMNMYLWRIALLIPCLVVFGMLVLAQSIKENSLDGELYGRGITVYLENYCGVCHELTAAQTLGRFGPSHDEAASLALVRLNDPDYGGDATTVEDYLRESIVNPKVYFTPGYGTTAHQMPAFVNLDSEALEALVYLLRQQE